MAGNQENGSSETVKKSELNFLNKIKNDIDSVNVKIDEKMFNNKSMKENLIDDKVPETQDSSNLDINNINSNEAKKETLKDCNKQLHFGLDKDDSDIDENIENDRNNKQEKDLTKYSTNKKENSDKLNEEITTSKLGNIDSGKNDNDSSIVEDVASITPSSSRRKSKTPTKKGLRDIRSSFKSKTRSDKKKNITQKLKETLSNKKKDVESQLESKLSTSPIKNNKNDDIDNVIINESSLDKSLSEDEIPSSQEFTPK